jgi:hypothetical protein
MLGNTEAQVGPSLMLADRDLGATRCWPGPRFEGLVVRCISATPNHHGQLSQMKNIVVEFAV